MTRSGCCAPQPRDTANCAPLVAFGWAGAAFPLAVPGDAATSSRLDVAASALFRRALPVQQRLLPWHAPAVAG